MRKKLEDALDRFLQVPTKQSIESRMTIALESHRNSLLKGIRDVRDADCYHIKVPSMRGYLLKESKTTDSFYHCKLVHDAVNDMIDSLDGSTHGCS
jgi:hypothetical protein